MIVYRQWARSMRGGKRGAPWYQYEGWFLLGLIPLYIRRDGCYGETS